MVARGEPGVTAEDTPRIFAPADDPRRPADERSLWLGTFLSLLLHLAIIAALLGLWRLPSPHEVVLQVALVDEGPGAAGAAGGAGEKAATPDDAAMKAAAASSTAPRESPAPAEAATTPSTTAAAPPRPASSPEAPIPPAPAAEPPKPPARPPHKPALPVQPALPVTAAAKPPPTTAASQPPAADTGATAAPTAAGVGRGPAGPSGAGKGAEGQGHGVVGNGPIEGPGDDYLDRLRRWLAKYKKYPEDALKRKIEGEVVVDFTLARDGTVLSARVEKSSGSATLDEAAVQMLHDASPVPPVPERYKGQELRISIPVDYSIGFFERLFR